MEIQVSAAVGTAPTKLAAFDAALEAMGAQNFNLIPLSSIIPPGATVHVIRDAPMAFPGATWGDRLHVVMADLRVDRPGEFACAGLGWVQDQSDGRGVFVEHVGRNPVQVRAAITQSLSDMTDRRGVMGSLNMVLAEAACVDRPVCALALAAYRRMGW